MNRYSVLIRLCSKVLIWSIIAGITTDFVASKTVTRDPKENTEPCIGPNCDHTGHKLDPVQPTLKPVVHMQQQNAQDVGAEPHGLLGSESNGLNIDPDSLLHAEGAGHAHHGAPPNVDAADAQVLGADSPDIKRELHGGVADQVDAGSGDVPTRVEHGPDMEATLHGGQKHVHSPLTNDDTAPSVVEHDGIFGVDPEEMLHGGAGVHDHGGESNQAESRNSEGNFNLGTDVDALLHGGDDHAHSPERRQEQGSDGGIPEVPIGATDPEAMLHDGDGHLHDHGGAKPRTDPDPRPFGAADPEQILHGSDEQHVHTIRQAMDGSRPLSGTKDPDVVGTDVNPMEVRVGTMRPEDTEDYHKWKSEKAKQSPDASSWLSGFSYIKDALLRDLEVVRKRYLPSIFGERAEEEEEEDGSTGKDSNKRTHDEA